MIVRTHDAWLREIKGECRNDFAYCLLLKLPREKVYPESWKNVSAQLRTYKK